MCIIQKYNVKKLALRQLKILLLKPEHRRRKTGITSTLYIYIYIEIEKVDVFRKVLNKQFIERLRALFIIIVFCL